MEIAQMAVICLINISICNVIKTLQSCHPEQ